MRGTAISLVILSLVVATPCVAQQGETDDAPEPNETRERVEAGEEFVDPLASDPPVEAGGGAEGSEFFDPSAEAAPPRAVNREATEAIARTVGCDPVGVRQHRGVLLVACRDRVLGLEVGGEVVRWSAPLPVPVRGIGLNGAHLVLITEGGQLLQPCPPGAAGPSATTLGEACQGRVRRVEGREVEVRLGPFARVDVGQFMAFYATSERRAERVGEGRVTEVNEAGRATVQLGPDERASVGDRVTGPVHRESSNWLVPRLGGRTWSRLSLGGIFPVDGETGWIFAGETAVYLDAPVVIRAGLAPLALGLDRGEGILGGLIYGSVGVDTDWLEVSLGVAGTTINQRSRGQATLAVAPLLGVRLGSAEGVSLEAQFFFTIDDVGIDLGVGRLRLTLPMTRRYRLVLRADAGRHGLVQTDGGFVFFGEGVGDRGSWSLGFFGGVGHTFYRSVCEIGECAHSMVLGPSLSMELGFSP